LSSTVISSIRMPRFSPAREIAQRRRAQRVSRPRRVLNHNTANVGRAQFRWIRRPGSGQDAQRLPGASSLCDQPGRGRARALGEAEIHHLHAHLAGSCRSGRHIDDIRYCPFHPEGTVRRLSPRHRLAPSPAPGIDPPISCDPGPVDGRASFLAKGQRPCRPPPPPDPGHLSRAATCHFTRRPAAKEHGSRETPVFRFGFRFAGRCYNRRACADCGAGTRVGLTIARSFPRQ